MSWKLVCIGTAWVHLLVTASHNTAIIPTHWDPCLQSLTFKKNDLVLQLILAKDRKWVTSPQLALLTPKPGVWPWAKSAIAITATLGPTPLPTGSMHESKKPLGHVWWVCSDKQRNLKGRITAVKNVSLYHSDQKEAGASPRHFVLQIVPLDLTWSFLQEVDTVLL